MTPIPYGRVRTKTAGELAHQWARQAVLEIVRESGDQIAARPLFRDQPVLGLGVADADPLSGLAAAANLNFAVRRVTVEYARLARKEGRSWRDIGVALGLKDTGMDVADAAYEHLAPRPGRPAFADREAEA